MKNDQASKKEHILLFAAIILTCLCLRAPITGVGPLTGMIQSDLHLSAAGAGMLTTIPLIVFAALSVLVGRIAGRAGTGNWLLISMCILGIGIGMRSLMGSGGLYAGTVLIGVGITAGNVLIPGIVKAYFPDRVGMMTGIYATVMTAVGGISSGISMPVASSVGWKSALMIWIVTAAAAAIIWVPNRGCTTENTKDLNGVSVFETPRRSVATSGIAWAIVFYFGIQSLVFYSFAAWLPAIMQAKGFDPVVSGYFSSVFILVGIPATFLVPIFSQREGDECALNVIVGLMFTAGMLLMIFSEHPVILMLGAIGSGLAVGACFSQSMALFGLRTRDAHDAAALSGLAQSVGYLFAAIGPAFTGWIYDISGSWLPSLLIMTGLAVVETILGYIVGKERIIFG